MDNTSYKNVIERRREGRKCDSKQQENNELTKQGRNGRVFFFFKGPDEARGGQGVWARKRGQGLRKRERERTAAATHENASGSAELQSTNYLHAAVKCAQTIF